MAKKKPIDQSEAIEDAFVAGTLPEEDRRAPEEVLPEPPAAHVEDGVVVEDNLPVLLVAPTEPIAIPNDQIHVIREREDGVRVDAAGNILI